jgi:hypothetical protein
MIVNPTEAAGLCIAIVGSFFSVVLLARAFLRRATKCTRTNEVRDAGKILEEYR